MSKQPPPAPTASAVGPCPTVIQIVRRPGTGSLPSTTHIGKKMLLLQQILSFKCYPIFGRLCHHGNKEEVTEVIYLYKNDRKSCLEVIKLFSCSTQLSMEFFLLINVKMPTNVGILTFMSGKK